MPHTINLVKLSVGTKSVEGLTEWQASPMAQTTDGFPRHITRMWPKREAALTNGGSIYWIIKGTLLCRQTVLRLDEVIGSDGIRRCAIVSDPKLIRVAATPRRAFQGWRYLEPAAAPPDLGETRQHEETLPHALQIALADIGIL